MRPNLKSAAVNVHLRSQMLQVLAIPELAAMVIDRSDEIKIIAALRMVCRGTRDIFTTQIGEQVKVRGGVAYTATTYKVGRVYAREPYRRVGVSKRGFLQRVTCHYSRRPVPAEDADVIHVYKHAETGETITDGFEVNIDDFININRLFGLDAAAYTLLLGSRWYFAVGVLPLAAYSASADKFTVTDLGIIHQLQRDNILAREYAAYYMFYGHVHGCDADVGNYNTLERLEVLKW